MSNTVINPYNFALPLGLGAWKELGRTTLGSPATSITVSGLPDKQYLMVLMETHGAGGNANWLSRIGNGTVDTGSNYARRQSDNGAADTTATSVTTWFEHFSASQRDRFGFQYIANTTTKEKLGVGEFVDGQTAGSGTAPSRNHVVDKWVDTSNPIDIFTLQDDNALQNFGTGSEVVILGYDPTDTHTTADNFWEELASVSADGSSNTLSASIISKKYLWVQCYEESSAGSVSFRVGNTTLDSGNNYSARVSSNGGSEDVTTGIDAMMGLTSTTPILWNFFIINNSANEKLAIGNVSRQTTAGAGNVPSRVEGVYKWDNTSNQIDILGFVAVDVGATILSNSTLKVWGSD